MNFPESTHAVEADVALLGQVEELGPGGGRGSGDGVVEEEDDVALDHAQQQHQQQSRKETEGRS